ncbi:LysM peptidoglycan-binding domain-containing protein [Leucobacter sp. PH1c]|uniref:LysM peptidoglycan-binding domain-containing protein n=1 Tax=Leucobacter sp. PH1c TaxID=1397278 RepID=UPI000469BABD|nr:LysM peptidoglycan-binding domain-containing protein [Leucobacter sp. PH1c]
MSAATLTGSRITAPASVAAERAVALAAPTRLRLTRRGRIVLGALATVVVAAALALLATFAAPQASAADPSEGGQEFSYVVVTPGSSLWEVATELDPTADPRDLVAEIVHLNQLVDSGVDAGQPLAVPLRYADSPATIPAAELGLPE